MRDDVGLHQFESCLTRIAGTEQVLRFRDNARIDQHVHDRGDGRVRSARVVIRVRWSLAWKRVRLFVRVASRGSMRSPPGCRAALAP